jgi:hypothetical protein
LNCGFCNYMFFNVPPPGQSMEIVKHDTPKSPKANEDHETGPRKDIKSDIKDHLDGCSSQ